MRNYLIFLLSSNVCLIKMCTYLLPGTSASKMHSSWTINVNNNLQKKKKANHSYLNILTTNLIKFSWTSILYKSKTRKGKNLKLMADCWPFEQQCHHRQQNTAWGRGEKFDVDKFVQTWLIKEIRQFSSSNGIKKKVNQAYLTTEYAGLSCKGFEYVCQKV